MIRIEHLSKTFVTSTNEVHALKDVNAVVETGDIFGVIGMSGAGKSTLLRCIAQLETPTEGSIFIEDSDITKLSKTDRRDLCRHVGIVFQGYHLLMQRTVKENIAFPLELVGTPKDEINSKVDELLKIVGLEDKAQTYPSQLSGGQRQRVAIARALANNPSIILCDEPTSALDSLTTKAILKLLKEINESLGVTVFIITHEIGVVKSICRHVAVINEGQLVEVGETEKVFANPQNNATKLLLGISNVEEEGDDNG